MKQLQEITNIFAMANCTEEQNLLNTFKIADIINADNLSSKRQLKFSSQTRDLATSLSAVEQEFRVSTTCYLEMVLDTFKAFVYEDLQKVNSYQEGNN